MITSVLFHDDITVACAVGPSVNLSSTEFSLAKPGFFFYLFEFSAAEITFKSISPTF
jgi:hypothetical protein